MVNIIFFKKFSCYNVKATSTYNKISTWHIYIRLRIKHGCGAGWIFNKSSAVAEMGEHMATTDMGQKVGRGLLCPSFLGSCRIPI